MLEVYMAEQMTEQERTRLDEVNRHHWKFAAEEGQEKAEKRKGGPGKQSLFSKIAALFRRGKWFTQ